MGTTWDSPEKRRTQADVRRDKFNEAGALAKAIGDVALEDIDRALADNETVRHSLLFDVWMSDEAAHHIVG